MPIVKREDKFNSSDGLARKAPDVKVTGTRLVAEVMRKAERGQPNQDQQDRDRMGVAFTRLSPEMSKNTVKND
jgi:hypothetical protein